MVTDFPSREDNSSDPVSICLESADRTSSRSSDASSPLWFQLRANKNEAGIASEVILCRLEEVIDQQS